MHAGKSKGDIICVGSTPVKGNISNDVNMQAWGKNNLTAVGHKPYCCWGECAYNMLMLRSLLPESCTEDLLNKSVRYTL